MKRHARKAFTALKKIGAPVFERDDERDGPYFILSAEDNSKQTWADYYMMTDGPEPEGWRFGVCAEVIEILDANGLYCEWENPGCLCVFDG